MNTRELGSTGYDVSEVGLGTWEIGGEWGDVDEEAGRDAVRAALDAGVNFLDTADVYGDGRSERLIREVLDEREADSGAAADGANDGAVSREDVVVATKAGRRLDPHEADRYTRENLERFVDRSREHLGVDSLDLLQLHCPPTETYYQPETFDALADLQSAGKLDHYGVSVEKVEEGMKAIEYPGVETVQIIFNPLRQRPARRFLDAAAAEDVGVIVRVPLASGLLTGAIDEDTEFPENDHRNFNREGDAFDVGETFAGVPLDAGVAAVDELREYVPEQLSLPQFALRWILDFDAVSTVIPGSTSPEHVRSNAAASNARPLEHRVHGAARDVYEKYAFEHVHHRW